MITENNEYLTRLEMDISNWWDKDTTRPLPALMVDVESIVLAHKSLHTRCTELEAEIARLSGIANYE